MSEDTQGKDITLYLWMIQDAMYTTQTGVALQLQGIYEQLQKIANKDIPTVSAPKK